MLEDKSLGLWHHQWSIYELNNNLFDVLKSYDSETLSIVVLNRNISMEKLCRKFTPKVNFGK